MIIEGAKRWARNLKRDVVALWIAARDPRTPWYAKAVAGAIAAYALSPIDLIPDFIPILGYLDELVVLPLGIALAIHLVPPELMGEFRRTAASRETRPRSVAAAITIAVLWGVMALVVIYLAYGYVR